jgi:hypothetical protein
MSKALGSGIRLKMVKLRQDRKEKHRKREKKRTQLLCRKPRGKLTQHDVISHGHQQEIPALAPIVAAVHGRT